MKNQKDFIYKQLVKNGKVSRNLALRHYISRLSGIIFKLRYEKGLDIKGSYVKTKNGRDFVYFLVK